MNRIIVVRFDNENDLQEFNLRNDFDLTKNHTYYSLIDNTSKLKVNRSIKYGENLYDITMKEWVNMPHYFSKKKEVYCKVRFEVGDLDSEYLSNIFNQKITDKTKSIWFPKLKKGGHITKRVVKGKYVNRVPIYIVSKGRADRCYTSKFLVQCEVPHYIVVEPFEIEEYKKFNNSKYTTVLELDLKYKEEYDTFDNDRENKNIGPGASRNFAWEHSIKLGKKYHWVMDDNAIEGFHWVTDNEKIKLRTGAFLNAMENFIIRYDNIAISGMNYSCFVKLCDRVPPFNLNTRIYSFLLIKNDIPYRWRGRYNEDTDLSLRVLKDGWCTLQFNTFTAGKSTTQKVKGGNTEEFYKREGTYPKSKMLVDMHPDLVRLTYKFSRVHHEVNYRVFNQKLHRDRRYDKLIHINVEKDYGMVIINTNEKNTNDTKSYLENKYLGGGNGKQI